MLFCPVIHLTFLKIKMIYFATCLPTAIKSSKQHSFKFRLFIAIFDEYSNKILKRGQMDLHVPFLDIENNCVARWYFNSKFVGKAAVRIFMKSLMNAYLSWIKTNFCRSALMDPT